MPTRTEVVISIGEVLECLPPGKSYRRKRYNSFDANQALEAGNEENVAPLYEAGARCDPASIGMKSRENGVIETELEPKVLTVRRKTRGSEDDSRKPSTEQGDEDDEVSFNPDTVTAIVENGTSLVNGDDGGGNKSKSKRKSSAEKFLEDNASYFQLEVLPSKTRSSKNFDSSYDLPEKRTEGFHNSFLDFLKSKGVEGKEESDAERSRSRHKSGPVGGASRQSRQRTSSCHQSPLRSDSEDSFRPPRSRSQYSRARSRNRLRSRSRDFSASESETDNEKQAPKPRRVKNANRCIESSDDESVTEENLGKSTRSRGKTEPTCSPSPGKRARRSELDKLLEAVDTSFHFETAAAAAKRKGESNELGPLEIDVSDSNVDSGDEDDSTNGGKKRKHSETDGSPESKRKKKKVIPSGDLLKTLSPRGNKKSVKETDSDEESEPTEQYWDGWEALHETLAETDSNPIELDKLHFSFESAPYRESWFQTYSRQDRGEDLVFYPESKSFPFRLPFELPYSTFMPYKPELKTEEKVQNLPKSSKGIVKSRKGKRKKVSECDSTDSENNKRGKPRFGPKTEHLLDLHPRISPRCHASTKVKSAILHGGNLTDEELAEALLIEEEREFNHPALVPFYNQDETSNDSMSSTRNYKKENIGDYLQIAASMDTFLRNTQNLGNKEDGFSEKGSDKVTVPTRSRISSEELLKNMKDKDKGKKKRDKTDTLELYMDKTVADNVDGILLDCLEDELPTIPFDSTSSDTLSLLDTYQSCKSMNVCNSRWLRPSRPSILSPQPESSQPARKSILPPSKPKRLVIYKEDLPGFKYDNDIETEKLPVSKRILAKSAKKEEPEAEAEETETPSKKEKLKPVKKLIKKEVFIARKEKPKIKSEPRAESDEDNVSEASTESSRSRKKIKKRSNKTGFPTTKKKKKVQENKESEVDRKEPQSVGKKKNKDGLGKDSSPKKIKKKAKLDKFITKKKSPKSASPKSSSPSRAGTSDLGRRSTTLQSKNYSELESDTESLFEAKVPYRSPHMKMMLKEKPAVKAKKRK